MIRPAFVWLKRLSGRAGLVVWGAALFGCQGDLPPFGQVLVVVDTDLPAPRLASRLRIDLFDSAGRWYDSFDTPRPNTLDWPATFSLYSDGSGPVEVLARLRVYPEGKVRAYLGERFEERVPYVEPPLAKSLTELCAAPIDLPLGQTRWVRRGADPFTILCPEFQPEHGHAAAAVDVTEAGAYRFGVVQADPAGSQVTLALRTTCGDGSSNLACVDGALQVDRFFYPNPPSFTLDLEPGRYFMLTSGFLGPGSAADLLMAAARADAWTELSPPPGSGVATLPSGPRLVRGGTDATPEREPQPDVTVDRLVRVRLHPDTFGAVRVTLRGACAGTMSRLGTDPPHQEADLEGAETCIDADGVRVPVALEPVTPDRDAGPSAQGAFARSDRPCPSGADPAAPVACVEGGAFVLGSAEIVASVGAQLPSTPERIAHVRTFWMDRHEVTIGRWRAAIAGGLTLADEDLPKDGSMYTDPFHRDYCLWRPEPGAFEDHPAACLSWHGARTFCQAAGGDLPTEAQWEYAATKAGREHETRYPWGDEAPSCTCMGADETCVSAVYARNPDHDRYEFHQCLLAGEPPGPVSVLAVEASGDAVEVSPGLRIVGLGGNVAEWIRDAGRAFDHPCWRAAPTFDPACIELELGPHALHGGTWVAEQQRTNGANRGQISSSSVEDPGTGFRCAYAEPPPW